MSRFGPILALLVLTPGAVLGGQRPANSAPNLKNELSQLITKHLMDGKSMRADANRLALRFRSELRQIDTNVRSLEARANTRFGQTDWRQKGALIMEFWRIRSSIDLLALLSPNVFKEVTGYDLPNLKIWEDGLKEAAARFRGAH